MIQKPYQISLIAPSGRLFERDSTQPNSSTAHLATFDFGRQRYATHVAFNQVGDIFSVTDSLGNVVAFHISRERGNNRYSTVIRGYTNASALAFSSNKPDQLLISPNNTRNVHVLALNGKIIATLQGHKSQVKNFAVNAKRGVAMSCSNDATVIWNLQKWKKQRQMFAQTGAGFVAAKFTPDGDKILTLFSDSKAYLWTYGGGKFEMDGDAIQLWDGRVNSIDIGNRNQILCGYTSYNGRQKANYIYYSQGGDRNQQKMYLPAGWHGSKSVQFVKGPPDAGRGRFFILNEMGILHLVSPRDDFRVEWSLRLLNASIIEFNCDCNGKYLVIISSDGRIILYDIPTLNTIIANKNKKRRASGFGGGEDIDIKLTQFEQENDDVARTILGPLDIHNRASQYYSSSHSMSDDTINSDIIFVKNGHPIITKVEKSASIKRGQRPPQVDPTSMQPLYQIAKLDMSKSKLNPEKLTKMLEVSGHYPQRYRVLIYRYLLSLPCNRVAFEQLYKRPIHSSIINLRSRFPVSSDSLFTRLQCTLSALAYWCPLFGQIQWLPAFVFPFINLVQNDDLICFELLVAILLQFCQLWFQYYPTEPIHVLTTIQQIIERQNRFLVSQLRMRNFSPKLYALPLLQSAFSQFLQKDDFMMAWDMLITHHNKPQMMLYFTAALLLSESQGLLSIQSAEQMHLFTMRQHTPDMRAIIKLTNEGQIGSNLAYASRLPLAPPPAPYPVFDSFPKYVVQQKELLREKIIRQQDELQRRQHTLKQLQMKTKSLTQQELRLRKQQQDLIASTKERQNIEARASQILMKQKIRVENISRENRLKQLQDVEQALQISLAVQNENKQLEMQRLLNELERRKQQQEQDLKSRLQNEHISNMETQAARRLHDMMAMKRNQQQAQLFQAQIKAKVQQEKTRDHALEERWRTEDEARRLERQQLRQKMLNQNRERQAFANRRALQVKAKLQNLEKEVKVQQVERERKLRQMHEDQMLSQDLLKNQMQQKEQLLKREDERQMRFLINEEMQLQDQRAKQRMQQLQNRKRDIEMTREKQRIQAEKLEKILQQRQFEDKLMMMRHDLHQREKDQNKRLDELQADIERQTALRTKIQQDLLDKERELRQKSNFQLKLQQTEENVRRLQKEKYDTMKQKFREDMEDMQRRTHELQAREREKVYRSMQQRENSVKNLHESLKRKQDLMRIQQDERARAKNKMLNEQDSPSPQRKAFQNKSPISSQDEEYNATATFRDVVGSTSKYPQNFATAGANRHLYPPPGNNAPIMQPNQTRTKFSNFQNYPPSSQVVPQGIQLHQFPPQHPVSISQMHQKPAMASIPNDKRHYQNPHQQQEDERKLRQAHQAVKSGYRYYKSDATGQYHNRNQTYHGPQDTLSPGVNSQSESLNSDGDDEDDDDDDDYEDDDEQDYDDDDISSGLMTQTEHQQEVKDGGEKMKGNQGERRYMGASLTSLPYQQGQNNQPNYYQKGGIHQNRY